MMQQTTSTITTAKGFTVHTASWRTIEEPKGVVILVHGYGEHHGRYLHVIETLNKAGYAIFTLDHVGHGKSSGERAYVESIDALVADLRQYVEASKKEFPSQKIFMYGHSMGALISLVYALRYQDELNGLILSGVPLGTNESTPAALLTVAKVLNGIVPKMALVTMTPGSELAADQSVALAFDADPLNWKGKMRVRTGVSISSAVESARAQINTLRLPLLLIHGAEDKICPPAGSQFALEHAASPDKRLISYPGLRHEIHNEKTWKTVMQDVITWLDGHQ